MIDTDRSGVSWDDSHEAYVARFDVDGRSPSVVVAEALEAARTLDAQPLFDYVDPDALDDLVDDPSKDGSVTVSFEVDAAVVTVHGDGRVFVRT